MRVWVQMWVGLLGAIPSNLLKGMAGTTGLEPAASAVTGQRSNQLNYVPTPVRDQFAKPRTSTERNCHKHESSILASNDRECYPQAISVILTSRLGSRKPSANPRIQPTLDWLRTRKKRRSGCSKGTLAASIVL